MFASRNNGLIIIGLLTTVFLWGGNNAGVKFLVHSWPPMMVGSSRFLAAGLLMLALLRWTHWLGEGFPPTPDIGRSLWWRGGLSLAAYVAVFNLALRYTSASHVALYLAASPVWALLWEGRTTSSRMEMTRRYGAALLALAGVLILVLPVLKSSGGSLRGELLGLTASLLWTNHGRQCRVLGQTLSGAAVSAHSMFRAGVILLPFALLEISGKPLIWEAKLFWVQAYCIVGGGILAFAFWNNALRHWKTSEVYLFINLIPLSTMLWARFCLDEKITGNFWFAMALIVAGVAIGQARWEKFFGRAWLPAD